MMLETGSSEGYLDCTHIKYKAVDNFKHYQIPFTREIQKASADTINTSPYRPNKEKITYLLVLMIITPLMRLELVDPAVSFLAQFAVE